MYGKGHKGGSHKKMKSPSYAKSTAASRQKSGHAGGTKLKSYGKTEVSTQTNRYPR